MAIGETYEEFTEKFKPKKTTDDCYTPLEIYECVKDWAVEEYHLEGRPIVRPFFPGGDFEHYDYPADCVVIDNPPFSILAKIKKFYMEKGIDFFLFAPSLTLMSSGHKDLSHIVTHADITYENGALVRTSFVTNLDTCVLRTAPILKKRIEEENKKRLAKQKKHTPKYKYPYHVVSSALLGKYADFDFRLDKKDCMFIRKLDSQKGKTLFGAGFLISEQKALEQKALEQCIRWELSDREKEIIKSLG